MIKNTPKRIVDINGYIINDPEHYHDCLSLARQMIDKLEEDNVDRSDMLVVINRLIEEMRFTLCMYKDRD